MNAGIEALNWFCGCLGLEHEKGGAKRGRRVLTPEVATHTQREVTARATKLCGDMHAAVDAIPSQQAAFRELLHDRSIYEDGASAGLNVARCSTADSVSLPESLEGSPYVDEVMPTELFHYLLHAMERMTRSASELEGCNLEQPQWDPRLRTHRPTYLRLMKHFIRLG